MQRIPGATKPLKNQRGIALVVAILLLMVITLFGAVGITMSTRELRGAGGKRLEDQRFYEAQTALSQALLSPNAMLTDAFLNAPVTTAENPLPPTADLTSGTPLASVTIWNIQDVDLAIAAQRELPVMPHSIEPPAGSGYSLGDFRALHFSVTSATLEPNENDRTIIREGVWRAFKIVK